MAALSKDTILDVLNFIEKKKIENSPSSYISIKNTFKLFSIPIPIITIPAGTKLFRLRIHNEPDILFQNIKDIGHQVARNNIKEFGRANEPLQSVFYCSDIQRTSFCETSKLIRSSKKPVVEESTTGIWITKRDIMLAALPKDNNKGENPTVAALNKDFNKFVAKYDHVDFNNLQYFHHKIAEEFSAPHTPDNCSYLVTAAFANYIFETKMKTAETNIETLVDGITYPSVQWDSEGMNLALRPELIENRDIELQKAIFHKMELVNSKTYIETKTIQSKKTDYDNWRIMW